MPDVSVFQLNSQQINVKDATARSESSQALSKATEALSKVDAVVDLPRIEVSYVAGTETITIKTADHTADDMGG